MTNNLPTTITWLRIALIPLFVVAFYLPVSWSGPAASVIFSLAGITDWLDGYLARRLGQTSAFGAFLDPVADKLMVITALFLLTGKDGREVVAIAAAVIVGREIAVSALREWMAELGQRHHVAVSNVGKYKTTFQIIALILMLWEQPLFGIQATYDIGYFCLLFAAGLTLWSMAIYLRNAWPVLKNSDTG